MNPLFRAIINLADWIECRQLYREKIVQRPVVLPNHLDKAIEDANARFLELVKALCNDHPQIGDGTFAGIIAGRALYMTTYAYGVRQARLLAANAIVDCDADMKDAIRAFHRKPS
jgi:hypothetical protein